MPFALSQSYDSAQVATLRRKLLAVAIVLVAIAASSFARAAETDSAEGVPAIAVSSSTVAATSTATASAKEAPACCAINGLRPGDQIWLISCRSQGCGAAEATVERMQYWTMNAAGGSSGSSWSASSRAAFLAADDASMVTSFAVHGNQITANAAVEFGWGIYLNTLKHDPGHAPIRFVIWSWPSDATDQPIIDDVRTKIVTTRTIEYSLAWLLNQIKPDVQVTLTGYSLGARIITGALHLLGGGSVDGHAPFAAPIAPRKLMRVVLIASALDCDWLAPGHRHGQAMSQIERLLLINNGCDQALRRYPRLYCRRGGPEALGFVGLCCGNLLGADLAKVSQMDVCCMIGKKHDWTHYVCTPGITARWAGYAL